MNFPEIYSATGMMELIQKIGFLPLLDSGIEGFSAEDIVAEDCRYVTFPEGGWDWPLWKWKSEIVQEMPCMYGKFFNKKAGFISEEWWPDFCNYRRSKFPRPDDDSIEGAILCTLQSTGSLITRELRAACGFTGKGMRSKFDGYLTRLEMATYIVTEDFIYPRDKHNHEYGWGWSLLNTPEDLYGREACQCNRTPMESYQRIFEHLKEILPDASDKQIKTMKRLLFLLTLFVVLGMQAQQHERSKCQIRASLPVGQEQRCHIRLIGRPCSQQDRKNTQIQ